MNVFCFTLYISIHLYLYLSIYLYIYIYIYTHTHTNFPVNAIVKLVPNPWSGDTQGQETFLAPSADNQTCNYDTECSNHHPSLSTPMYIICIFKVYFLNLCVKWEIVDVLKTYFLYFLLSFVYTLYLHLNKALERVVVVISQNGSQFKAFEKFAAVDIY